MDGGGNVSAMFLCLRLLGSVTGMLYLGCCCQHPSSLLKVGVCCSLRGQAMLHQSLKEGVMPTGDTMMQEPW